MDTSLAVALALLVRQLVRFLDHHQVLDLTDTSQVVSLAHLILLLVSLLGNHHLK
jgi:hypothetical protein